MRIISGVHKGKKILLPINKNTRPLRDLVKESIFNLIQHSSKFDIKVSNSDVLDLFSGSGSFGLECISRGSNSVTFVESYLEAIKILKRNILNLKGNNKCKIFEENCFDLIKRIKDFTNKFDIIFLDPPYKENNINFLIITILEKKILKKNGIIVLHRHKKDTLEISKKLKTIDQRLYGISKIIIGN